MILARWGLAFVYGLKGEFSLASGQLEHALALSRDWNVPVLAPITTGFLGYVSALLGDVEEGLSSQQQGMKDQESGGLRIFHSLLVARLGETLMLADRIEEALAQCGFSESFPQ